jgi:hypothetical protein
MIVGTCVAKSRPRLSPARYHTMRTRASIAFVLCLCLTSTPSFGQEPEQPPSDEGRSISDAEKARLVDAMNRVEARFQKTLDVRTFYDDEFSPRAARLALASDDDQPPVMRKKLVDDATLKRTYIATLNLIWLGLAFHNGKKDRGDEAA